MTDHTMTNAEAGFVESLSSIDRSTVDGSVPHAAKLSTFKDATLRGDAAAAAKSFDREMASIVFRFVTFFVRGKVVTGKGSPRCQISSDFFAVQKREQSTHHQSMECSCSTLR